MRLIRKHRFKKYKFFSDQSGNAIVETASGTISEIISDLEKGKGDLIEKLKKMIPNNGENIKKVPQNVIENITEQVVEEIDDTIDKEKSSKYAGKKMYHNQKNYAKGPLSGLIKDIGINGAAKAITSAITSGLSAITTIPYIGPVIENLGEAVITPTMMAVPGSMLIYTLVKKGLIEPAKFDHGVKEVENILKSVEDKNTGCIKVKDVKEISEKITSLFISGKDSPIRKILNWVKDEMIKSKKAKDEQEAYMKINEALAS